MCSTVSYVNKRPLLPMSLFHRLAISQMSGQINVDIANDIIFLSFLHKSDHWSYEREARIFFPFDAFKERPFDPDELIGFILGPNSSPELEARMRTEIAARQPSTALYKSVLSSNDFRIIIPRKFYHTYPA